MVWINVDLREKSKVLKSETVRNVRKINYATFYKENSYGNLMTNSTFLLPHLNLVDGLIFLPLHSTEALLVH